MKSKVILIAAVVALLASGCGKKLPLRLDYTANSKNFLCQLKKDAFYQVACFTLEFRPPDNGYIQHVEGAEDVEYSQALPTSEQPGRVEFEEISGVFKAKVYARISPSLALGLGPPACGQVNPLPGANVGTIVINWKLHGEIEYVFGHNIYVVEPPRSIDNMVITHSEYHFDEFDIDNIPDLIDDAVLEIVKSSIKRAVDQAVHDELTYKLNLVERDKQISCSRTEQCDPPVYAEDEGDEASGSC